MDRGDLEPGSFVAAQVIFGDDPELPAAKPLAEEVKAKLVGKASEEAMKAAGDASEAVHAITARRDNAKLRRDTLAERLGAEATGIDLVHEFRQEAQLLIVSHQKRTMEAADCLYGITMQPGGSSRAVSETTSVA